MSARRLLLAAAILWISASAVLAQGTGATLKIQQDLNWYAMTTGTGGGAGCSIATTSINGCVHPDGSTITIDGTGLISAVGGGGSVSITATTNPCLTVTPSPITGTGTIVLQDPLSVACGGTGDSTLTAHSVLLGEGTSPVAFATIGTAGRYLRDNGSGADPSMTAVACGDLPAGGCPFDIVMFMPGVPANSAIVDIAIVRSASCVAGFTGSVGKAETASTGTAAVTVKQNGTSRGTMTFTASATGVPASGSGMTLASGDIVQFLFPASADATLADIAITLKCART